MDQIVTQINAMSLAGLGGNGLCQKRIAPWDRNKIHSGITVHLPVQEHEMPGTHSCDDIAYPIQVTIVRGTSGSEESTHIDRLAVWRQKIRREFIHQRLSGVDTVYTCRVQFGRVLLPSHYRDNYHATTMSIVCMSRESRGN
jgi:hypothetical protein